MKSFIIGTIFGIFVSTVGLSGLLNIAQKGVDVVKTQSQELAK